MADFDTIWRTQDEIRTVVNAVLGAIVLELTVSLDEDAISDLCSQFPAYADYDGEGTKGTKFVFFLGESTLFT